ncbi:MAG: NUDIX hydrolase [Xanthobacteraceae bacterium]|uniref:NUDIX hydrolase n=1 Tax=Pseudolabrys sp. TaxID=1960880 RepID=UPI003D12C574
MTVAQRCRNWLARFAARSAELSPVRQAGAIPYTVVEGRAVFLLITSRRSGRWIFPKGAPIEGHQPWQVAAREAYEEAGIEGEIEPVSIGSYRTLKRTIPPAFIDVDMYALRMVRQLDDWPERGKRHRHWVILPEAKRLLSDPKLAALAAELDRRLAAQPATVRMSV